MGHVIEEAKSGRARCRACRQAIAKGELRFGEEVPGTFGEGEMTFHWFHLPCAAKRKPTQLAAAVETWSGTLPEEVLSTMREGVAKLTFPYAERAPTGRSKCLGCGHGIEKEELRIAVEREIELMGQVRKSPGYLHPACAKDYVKDETLRDKVSANSTLEPEELAGVLEQL